MAVDELDLAARAAGPAGRRTRAVAVGGASLWVAEQGDGPPILLLMGLGGNVELWAPVERELGGRRTIAFDVPGTGRSPAPLVPPGVPGIARLAVALLDELGHDEVDVLGFSFGGAVAQQLAYRAPRRVRRLVLVSTNCGLWSVPAAVPPLAVLANPWLAPLTFGSTVLARWVHGGEQQSEAMRTVHRNPPSAVGYLHQLFAMATWTSAPWLERIVAPTLVVAGDDDPLVPLANAHVLASRIPHAELHVVRGGGHLALLDDVESVMVPVRRFLGGPASPA